MVAESHLLDDLARVASGAFSAFAGLREEIEARLREQFEEILTRFDLVRRDEFEAVKAMAAKARVEQEALAARLAVLEARFGQPTAEPAPTSGEAPVPVL
jgi:BMFP domain-containing protein YqiC